MKSKWMNIVKLNECCNELILNWLLGIITPLQSITFVPETLCKLTTTNTSRFIYGLKKY